MFSRKSPCKVDSNCELNSLTTAYYRILQPSPFRYLPPKSLSPGNRSALSHRPSRLLCVTPKLGKNPLTPTRTPLRSTKTDPRAPLLEPKYLKLVPFRENFYQQTAKNRVNYDPVRRPRVSKKVRVDLELPEVVVHTAKPWSIESSLDL
jgi:hypothetical protein